MKYKPLIYELVLLRRAVHCQKKTIVLQTNIFTRVRKKTIVLQTNIFTRVSPKTRRHILYKVLYIKWMIQESTFMPSSESLVPERSAKEYEGTSFDTDID
jgi:hypothetical protein